MRNLLYCLFALLSLNPLAICANELAISPVNLDIAPGEKAAQLKLRNLSQEPIIVQLRAYPWENTSGARSEIVISPAMVEIPAGVEQLIRVVNIGEPSNVNNERLFKIFVDTLEAPNRLQNAAQQTTGVRLNVRYALPLFVGGPDLTAQRNSNIDQLSRTWEAKLSVSLEDGSQLRIDNNADLHARISKVKVIMGDTDYPIVNGLLGYVLPQSSELFPLATKLTPNQKIKFEVNGVPAELTLVEGVNDNAQN